MILQVRGGVVDTEHSLFCRFLSTAILADLATLRAKSSTIFVLQQQYSTVVFSKQARKRKRAASSRLVCIAQIIHLARSLAFSDLLNQFRSNHCS